MMVIKDPQRGYHQPHKTDYSKNAKRNENREWSIVVIPGDQRLGGLNGKTAMSGLFRQEEIAGVDGVTLAFDEVLGDLGQDLFPHLDPPFGGGAGAFLSHGIYFDSREKAQSALGHDRQLLGGRQRQQGGEQPE